VLQYGLSSEALFSNLKQERIRPSIRLTGRLGSVAYPPLAPFVARLALTLFGPSLDGLRFIGALSILIFLQPGRASADEPVFYSVMFNVK
jgi:hypothetical protein